MALKFDHMFLVRLKRKRSVGAFTLFSFLLQTFLPTYMLAFDAFERESYVGIRLNRVDANNFKLSVRQKDAQGSKVLVDRVVAKENLEANLDLRTLFATPVSVPTVINHMRLLFNTEGNILLTSVGGRKLIGGISFETDQSLLLGGIQVDRFHCQSNGLTSTGNGYIGNLFYKSHGERLSTLSLGGSFRCQNLYMDMAKIALQTDVRFGEVHVYGAVLHEEGDLKGHRLAVHGGSFTNEASGDHIDFDLLQGDHAKKITFDQSGGEAKFKKIKGKFEKIHIKRGSKVFVTKDTLNEKESCFIEELDNDGEISTQQRVNIKNLMNHNKGYFKGLNTLLKARIEYLTWYADHLINEQEPPLTEKEAKNLVVKAEAHIAKRTQEKLNQYIPGTGTTYDAKVRHIIWWADDYIAHNSQLRDIDKQWLRDDAKNQAKKLKDQALASLQKEFEEVRFYAAHEANRRTPAYRYAERDAEIKKLKEQSVGRIESGYDLTLEDAYLSEGHHLTLHGGVMNVWGQSILQGIADVADGQLNMADSTKADFTRFKVHEKGKVYNKGRFICDDLENRGVMNFDKSIIDFRKENPSGLISSVSGLSGIEEFGRWSDKTGLTHNFVTVNFKKDLTQGMHLRLKGIPYGNNARKKMKVFAGDTFVGEIDTNPNQGSSFDRTITVSNLPPKGRRQLRFEIPHPQKPNNGDARLLGIAFQEMEIIPLARIKRVRNYAQMFLDNHFHVTESFFNNKGTVQSRGMFAIAKLDNYGKLFLTGKRSVIFGDLRNHDALMCHNSPLYIHDAVFNNQGILEVDHLHWINGKNQRGSNGGRANFGCVEGGFSYDNYGKLTVTGPYVFDALINHGNDQGGFAEAYFSGEGYIEKLTNAGKMKAEKKLSVGSFFLNYSCGELELLNLHWCKPHKHKLENHGHLTIHQCNGQHYPKAIMNGGHMHFRHSLGRFDNNLYNDRSNEHSGIVDGVEFDDLQNHGLLFLHHGYYYASNLHNPGTLSIGENAKDKTCFNATQVSNPGKIYVKKDFRVKQKGQDWGALFVDGILELHCMKHLNGANQLHDRYHARKILVHASCFKNAQNRQATHQHVHLPTGIFYNSARILFASLDLKAHSFKQENLGVIGTIGDVQLNVAGDVDNRHGIIHAGGNGRITAQGNVLNGQPVHDVYYRNIHGSHPFWIKPAVVRAEMGLEPSDIGCLSRAHMCESEIIGPTSPHWRKAWFFYESFMPVVHRKQFSQWHVDFFEDHRLSGLLPMDRAVDEYFMGHQVAYSKRKSNGAYIKAGGALHITAKNIDTQFASLIAGGQTEDTYALLLKAKEEVFHEAGLIESVGKACVEAKKFMVSMPPLACDDDPQGLQSYGEPYHITREVESGPRAQMQVRGDLECVVDQTSLYGTTLSILGNLTGKHGERISHQGTSVFKLYSVNMHESGIVKTKVSGGFLSGPSYSTSDHYKTYAHIPSVINVGGGINLQFHQYQFEGHGLLQGANVHLQGQQLVANGGDLGVAINPLQKLVMALDGGVLVALEGFVPAAYRGGAPNHGVLHQDRVFGADRPIPQSHVVGADPEGHEHEILEGAKSGRDVDLMQAMGEKAMLNATIHGFSLHGVDLSRIRVHQNVWDMLRPMFETAVQLKTESGQNVLALAAMHSAEHPLIAFMERLTFVEGFGETPVLYPFLYLPALFCKKLEKQFKIVAGENGDITIQVWDLEAKKLALNTLHNHVIVDGNRVELKDCEVKSKNTIIVANHKLKDGKILEGSFIDLGSLHETEKLHVMSAGPIAFGASRVVYDREVDAGNHKEKDYMNIAKVGKLKAQKILLESMGGSDVVFEGTKIDCPDSKIKMNGVGRVHFKAADSQFYTYRFDDDSDLFVQDVEQSMRSDTTFVLPNISHTLDIQGASGIVLDKIEKVQKKSGAKGYYTNTMLAMMAEYNVSADESQIYDVFSKLPEDMKDKIEYHIAREVREYERKHHFGPGPALVAAVAIITSLATWGAGASLMGASSAMGIGAANGALSSFASQAAVNMLTCEGDLGRAFKNTFSDQAAKKVIFAAVTAGVVNQTLASLGIDPNAAEHLREARAAQAAGNLEQGMNAAQHSQNLAAQAGVNSSGLLANADKGFKLLAEHGVRGVVGAGVSDIAGEDHPWRNLLRTTAANVIGQWGAGQIGDLDLSPLNSALAHAGLGGVMGGMLGGTGCVTSGALGAVAGEFFARHLYINGSSIEEAVKGGKIIAAFSGVLFGQNPTISAATGANAIDHNLRKHLVKHLVQRFSCLKQTADLLRKVIQKKEVAKKMAKEGVDKAANRNRVPGGQLRAALREVEQETGRKITSQQKKELIDYCLKNRNFEKLGKEAKLEHSRPFQDKAFKDKLIDAWEKMGGQTKVREWPKYQKDVIGSNGKVIRGAEAGKPYQAHHIVPQELKGPHAWWNMHPAPTPMHQSVLHGQNSKLLEIIRTLPQGVK